MNTYHYYMVARYFQNVSLLLSAPVHNEPILILMLVNITVLRVTTTVLYIPRDQDVMASTTRLGIPHIF